MLSMIPCSSDCVYQVDGYCMLETPAVVTNISGKGCVHRIELNKKTTRKAEPQSITALPRLQRPPVRSARQ